jgi:ECF sigma factor
MRRILLNYARDRQRAKRGGQAVQVSLSEVAVAGEEKSAELIALDEALVRLAAEDERKCRVVELRYFGGLSIEETAEALVDEIRALSGVEGSVARPNGRARFPYVRRHAREFTAAALALLLLLSAAAGYVYQKLRACTRWPCCPSPTRATTARPTT